MKEVNFILSGQTDFLKYLKSKFIVIHNSNVFFRDIHYGIMSFLNDQGMKTNYSKAEVIAKEVCNHFEKMKIFKRIDHQTWTLNYPDFALPRKNKDA